MPTPKTRLAFLITILLISTANAEPQLNDFLHSHSWISQEADSPSSAIQPDFLPFSFILDGKPSAQFLPDWSRKTTTERLDSYRFQRTTIYTDPASNLTVKCCVVEYSDFPAMEWTLYFSNTGQSDSPILENVQALDAPFAASPTKNALLHYALGSHNQSDDFAPRKQPVTDSIHLAPLDGRSSDGILPFFNLGNLRDGGVMLGVGWTGQWAAAFEKKNATQVRIKAGMERTHLRLHPGEEIRTPAILLLFYSGEDYLHGQNQLRRLLLKHYTPTNDGKPVQYPIAASPHAAIGFTDTSEANMNPGNRKYRRSQVPSRHVVDRRRLARKNQQLGA